jgi:NAD(P)-dependent dehydrogenase (short-subunit alcohol dehydrogenase family)/3-oxoacyl-(acyl-carrier-protein) synthase
VTGDFEGKIALVTGGAGSVGRLIVEGLARRGAHVLINCFHSYAKAKELARTLSEEGLTVSVYRASVAKLAQVERMFEEIRRDHGHLDILINNAASGAFVNLGEVTEDMLDSVFATNVKGALWCAQQARPLMRRGGSIVNVSSIGASSVMGHYLVTGITKAAVESLTRYLGAELAAEGIRVNTACGGPLDNPIRSVFPDPDRLGEKILDATPLARLGTSQDLADLVLVLASDRLGFVTGQCLLCDGGLTLNSTVLTAHSPRPHREAGATSPTSNPTGPGLTGNTAPAPTDGTSALTGAVAVVGMGVRVPGASSPEEFWRLLTEGGEPFRPPPADRWHATSFVDADSPAHDKSYQDMAGFIPDTPDGTADHAQVWLRECLRQALGGVRHGPDDRVGVYLGYTPDGSLRQEKATVREELLSAGIDEAGARLLAGHFADIEDVRHYLPQRIAREAISGVLPDHTRIYLIDTACSSSLYAIDLGAREILSGAADLVVCGGGWVLTPTEMVIFSQNGGLSRTGALHALDANADGVLFAEGAGIITLKRLDRAVADGDPIYGVLAGSGLSADGKGTAIYAPSTAGQVLAIRRALRTMPPEDVDLVLAHATGTPAGDAAELAGLRQCYRHPVSVLANKSLVGHTGWAAGVVSVIHLLLALRHNTIPPQHHLRTPSEAVGHLSIPTAPRPWPTRSDRRPRVGAVSAFGFGGTNAHLLVQDYQPGTLVHRALPARCADDQLVLVGSASLRPDAGSDSFGPTYPSPPFAELRLPAAAVRRLDRAQLMLVHCMHRLDPAVLDACRRRKDRVGAILGHYGPTRNAVLYRCRNHLDDIECTARHANVPVTEFLRGFRDHLTTLIPPASEDSLPGIMPNVIAGRLANYFDLRGLNLTVDLGEASLIGAFEIASQYLAFDELDIALVGAVNGNILPSWRRMLGGTRLREAAFLFALTTRTVAEREELPVLATVDTTAVGQPSEPDVSTTDARAWHYGGAEGGAELVAFLAGDAPAVQIHRRPEPQRPPCVLRLCREAPQHEDLTRYVLSLAPRGASTVRPRQPIIPDSSVVLTNGVLAGVELPDDALTIEVSNFPPLSETDADRLLGGLRPRHIRVIADLSAPRDSVLRLHEAMFLTVRAASSWLTTKDSVVAYVLGGIDAHRIPHPLCGLFTGFVKALLSDLPEVTVLAVVHDAPELSIAAEDLAAETGYDHPLPVIYYADGHRLAVHAQPIPTTPGNLPLTGESVVLAAGGARGIGAEVLKGLASEIQSRIVILGSTPVDNRENGDVSDRRSFIQARTRGPERISVRAANAEFDRLSRSRQTNATLAELAALCGPDRVTYLACDLRDPAAVQHAVDHVLATAGHVDLLLNIAGISRTTAIASKSLADFIAVRDTKVLAHANLTAAFARRRPRIWCNFGSAAGFATVSGEADYCSANDFLFSAAMHAAAENEFTIGWSWWSEAGLAANPTHRSYFDSGDRFTRMTNRDGVRRFRNELADPRPHPAVVYLGARERTTLDQTAPGFLAETGVARPPAFYLDHVDSHTADALVATRMIDLDRDGYLRHHRVDGIPTVPGFFYVEMAAEAAARLMDGRIPAVFEDLQFASFLRIYKLDRPRLVRISAQRGTRDGGQLVIRVRITGDIVAPGGQLLVQDRLFATIDVLPDDPTPATAWPGWDDTQSHPITHPYYIDNPTVHLTGPFASTAQPRRHPRGGRARLRLDSTELNRFFGATATPIVTLDAMAQLTTFHRDLDTTARRAVPRHVHRIDLYGAPTDHTLAATPGPIELYGTPLDLDEPTKPNQAVAVGSDGTLIAKITNMTGVTQAAPSPPQLP